VWKQSAITIIDALRHPRLFGAIPAFRDLASWRPWLVYLKSIDGLGLDAEELGIFRRHTSRSTPRTGGYHEAVAIVGRQSGKSRVAAMVAAFEAIRTTEGAGTYAVLVSQDQRAALRTLFAYAAEPFERSPLMATSVVNRVADSITLENGAVVAA
jgi:hypothetical protein